MDHMISRFTLLDQNKLNTIQKDQNRQAIWKNRKKQKATGKSS